jgi:hypothetical protein
VQANHGKSRLGGHPLKPARVGIRVDRLVAPVNPRRGVLRLPSGALRKQTPETPESPYTLEHPAS